MITNPEIIQAILRSANRHPEHSRFIVEPLLQFGDVFELDGKWTFVERYANVSKITAGVVTTKYYEEGKLENLEPDLEETEGYTVDE